MAQFRVNWNNVDPEAPDARTGVIMHANDEVATIESKGGTEAGTYHYEIFVPAINLRFAVTPKGETKLEIRRALEDWFVLNEAMLEARFAAAGLPPPK